MEFVNYPNRNYNGVTKLVESPVRGVGTALRRSGFIADQGFVNQGVVGANVINTGGHRIVGNTQGRVVAVNTLGTVNSTAAYVNPGVQYVNTGAQYVNTGAQYVNTAAQYVNTGAQYVTSPTTYVANGLNTQYVTGGTQVINNGAYLTQGNYFKF